MESNGVFYRFPYDDYIFEVIRIGILHNDKSGNIFDI